MANFSRRQLAIYAVDQLLAKRPASEVSRHLAAALIAGKKQNQADLLLDDVAEQLESRGLVARATLTTATALSEELRARLTEQIKKAAGVAEVSLSEQIDPTVIGGFRVETTEHAWDETIARRLEQIIGGI